MSLPRSSEQRGASHALMTSPRPSGAALACALLSASLLLSACSTLDRFRGKKAEEPPATTTSSTSSSGGTISNTPTSAPSTATPENSPEKPPAPAVDEKGRSLFGFVLGRKKKATPPPETAGSAAVKPAAVVPPQARTEFDRAVGLMRAGKDTEAQFEFARIAQSYPQLASPEINLGILFRKANNLEKSQEALQEAVNRDRDSAVAWNELGVTQRLLGDFKSAQDSYESAIRADPDFAPAYRNLGVLLDLYVGDAEGALDNFERYKELSKEDKPVTGWIAELRARTGKPPIRNRPVAPASDSAPVDGSNENGILVPDVSGEGAPADGAASDSPTPAAPAATSPPGAAPAAPKRG